MLILICRLVSVLIRMLGFNSEGQLESQKGETIKTSFFLTNFCTRIRGAAPLLLQAPFSTRLRL